MIDPQAIGSGLEHPDPFVRTIAVRATGRIGSPAGIALIVPRLDDSDQRVLAETFFALGLIGHRNGIQPIVGRIRRSDSLSGDAAYEAAVALAKIGGDDAVRTLTEVISGGGDLARNRREQMLGAALINAWRLGSAAPVTAMLRYADHRDVDLRWRALYSLGRILAPGAGDAMLLAARDDAALIREVAARSLTARFADTTGTAGTTVRATLTRLLNDREMGVRIAALNSIATYRDSLLADAVVSLLDDPERQVKVAAAATLAQLGGSTAAAPLAALTDRLSEPWGVRIAALTALARIDQDAFRSRIAPWAGSSIVADRLAAIQAMRGMRAPDRQQFVRMTLDADSRVRAAALTAWGALPGAREDQELINAARAAADDPDVAVRTAAVPVLAGTMDDAVGERLAAIWRRGGREAQQAVISAIARLVRSDSTALARLAAGPAGTALQRPEDPMLRQYVTRTLPTVAARWGGVGAIETGRVLQDYREFVRVFLMAPANPRVMIDVEGRGTIEIELLAREAPLTVANFLRLLDRRYFDGSSWHRVVPNFVIQDGDPTGTGSGGPGWQIRDEINRHRYDVPMLGMALSGPDTGGSQWFINLSPQPHLDGGYTIFGKVVGSYNTARRVLQGDVIRTIRRVESR